MHWRAARAIVAKNVAAGVWAEDTSPARRPDSDSYAVDGAYPLNLMAYRKFTEERGGRAACRAGLKSKTRPSTVCRPGLACDPADLSRVQHLQITAADLALDRLVLPDER